MLELRNRTPFQAAIVPGLTKNGTDTVTVVVKGTFSLKGKSGDLRLADEQLTVRHDDDFLGEPGLSSLRHEADTSPQKKRTDIVLIGHAYAPRPGPIMDVRLAVGRVEKTVRVLGDRVWHRAAGAWRPTAPAPFERMPLIWERSFGGADTSDPDPDKHERETRNPLGTGLVLAERPERLEDLRLPNLEDPAALIDEPLDRPAPAGFGFLGRDFAPRAGFAGTYDQKWRDEKCPLLPDDFDDRYFNSAPPGLVAPRNLLGGEPVEIDGASPSGDLRFWVPKRRIEIELSIRRSPTRHLATMDTLCIEPDERRALVTWKVTVPCPRAFLHIEHVTITDAQEAL